MPEGMCLQYVPPLPAMSGLSSMHMHAPTEVVHKAQEEARVLTFQSPSLAPRSETSVPSWLLLSDSWCTCPRPIDAQN